MLPSDFYSFELHFEPAAAAILRNAGFDVVSPFRRLEGEDERGQPVYAEMPDRCCWVTVELGEPDPTQQIFREDERDGQVSEDGGMELILAVSHRVPIGLGDAQGGANPECYVELLRQRGAIRALFLSRGVQLREALPQYDILQLSLAAPDRTVDNTRLANEATERFRLRVTSTEDLSG